MDIDDNTQDLITPASTIVNGHISSSSHSIENKKDIFHQGYTTIIYSSKENIIFLILFQKSNVK